MTPPHVCAARRRAFLPLLVCLASLTLLLAATPAGAQSLSRWFLAEGANNALFTGEILVGNPGAQALEVTVRLLPQPDAIVTQPLTRTFPLAASSRLTVRYASDFGLNGSASAEVTAVVAGTATPADIVVDRTMYFPDANRAGGHNASGVTETATTWILAEGATTVFDTFVLVANPNPGVTRVRATYLTDAGAEFVSELDAPPNGRVTFWPRTEHAGLSSAQFSTVVESLTPGHGVVAERAMYFDYPPPGSPGFQFARSGHDALGVSAPSTSWYFAEGFTGHGGGIAFETFLLLANQHPRPVDVTVTYQLDSGQTVTRIYTVPARQRYTVWVDQEGRQADARLAGAAFGMSVLAPEPIVAERAMYWGVPSAGDPDTPSLPWVEGHDTAGAPARAAAWAFAEGVQDFQDASGLRYQTFLLFANPNPTPLAVRATFQREDGTGIQRSICVPANGRANIWTLLYPELSNRRFSSVVESIGSAAGSVCQTATTGGEPFVAERAVYWGNGYTGGHVNMGTPWTGVVAVPRPPSDPLTAAVVGNAGVAGNPKEGRLSGGEWVLIDVANAAVGNTEVFFDGRRSPEVQFLSPTRIRAKTPVGTPGGSYGAAGTRTVTVRSRGQEASAGTFRLVFRVLAIGDSFTEGIIVERNTTVTPPTEVRYVASSPYPAGLRNLLAGDGQVGGALRVDNEGFGGECASVRGCGGNSTSGASRITGLANGTAWDAVVIMEGFNDLNQGGQTVGSAVDALRFMGRTSAATGATVVMGILEPTMDTLAGGIASMANQEGFARHSLRGIEIGNDGVHPTQNGYDEMARQMYDKLKALFLP